LVGFEWDEHNLRKIRAHGIRREEAEQAIANDPISVYEQDVARAMYYAETNAGRLLAVVATMREGEVRVVTGYDLGAAQKRAYLIQRARGE
jgi:uncharacterized DUF497 family protein